MLSGIGKDAGLSAVQELHKTADDALGTLDHETIPAAEAAAKAIVGETVNGLYAVVVDLLNRLNGATVPVNLTLSVTAKLTGQIGALKLSVPEVMEAQTVEVKS